MKVDHIGIFWTRGEGLISRLIRWATQSHWNHTGLVFHMDSGATEYFDSLGDGWQGPKLLDALHAWSVRAPGRELVVAWLPDHIAGRDDLDKIRSRAIEHVGHRGYAFAQLAWLLLAIRYGIRVPRSPDRWVCSEAVSRQLISLLDLRDDRRPSFDDVTPGSAWIRLCEILAGYGSRTRPPEGRHRAPAKEGRTTVSLWSSMTTLLLICLLSLSLSACSATAPARQPSTDYPWHGDLVLPDGSHPPPPSWR